MFLDNPEANRVQVILERFANYTSTEDLLDSINDIYRDADNDPELKDWFRAVNNYIRTCLKEEGYIMRHESTEQYDRLYDHGNFLLRNRYRDHTDRVANEFRFLGDQFAADPDNQRFHRAMQKLFNDLGNDENGRPAFKKHLVKDVTQIIIPELFESVRYIPFPRIEYSDPMIDAVIENLIIESDNMMPNVLEMGNDNYFRFGRKTVSSKHSHTAMISASQIQCDIKGRLDRALLRWIEPVLIIIRDRCQLLYKEEAGVSIHYRYWCCRYLPRR